MNSCEGDEPALNVMCEREAPNVATNPEVIQQSARVANHAQPPFLIQSISHDGRCAG